VALNESELNGLLIRARLMDPEALGQLHDLIYPQTYRYIYFHLDDDQASQEITDAVLQGLLVLFQKGLSPKGKLDGWLLRSADKQIHAYQRQSGRSSTAEIGGVGAEGTGKSETLYPQQETSWGRRLVHLALRQLDPEQQRFLALRYTQSLSSDEIAVLTGGKLAKVKTLQLRALQSLRRFLEAAA
jgi:RNA polymerase sigma-70 factor (ECF subfamily)